MFKGLESTCECVEDFDGWGVCVDPVNLDDFVVVSIALGCDSFVAFYDDYVMWVFSVNPHRANGG